MVTKEKCADDISSLSEVQKKFFPYIKDSVFTFKEKNTEGNYYLKCEMFEIKKDSSFWEDVNCINNGFIKSWEFVKILLSTNMPFLNNKFLFLTINVISPGSLEIKLKDTNTDNAEDNTNSENFVLWLKSNASLVIPKSTSYCTKIVNYDSIIINNKIYYNVAEISDTSNAYYDKLFYNKTKGILKIISTKQGYNFEISE
jgi:hypothetical protein